MTTGKTDGAPSVHEGFPNPATDGTVRPMDLNQLVVKNPTSTFYMRIASDDYEEIGIYRGDILVIDRSLTAKKSSLAVLVTDGEFKVGKVSGTAEGKLELWGVVSHIIHKAV